MSGGRRIITVEELNRVQNLVEYCITHYLTRRQTIENIAAQTNIEPAIAQSVWGQLESENQDFFRAYYTRLELRRQIRRFNQLLRTQQLLMQRQNQNQNNLINGSTASVQQPVMHLLNGRGPQSNGDHQQPLLLHQTANNGSGPQSNGHHQQPLVLHQTANNGSGPQSNGHHQQPPVLHQTANNGNGPQSNGRLQPRSNGDHHQPLVLHQTANNSNGPQSNGRLQPPPQYPRSNGDHHQPLVHHQNGSTAHSNGHLHPPLSNGDHRQQTGNNGRGPLQSNGHLQPPLQHPHPNGGHHQPTGNNGRGPLQANGYPQLPLQHPHPNGGINGPQYNGHQQQANMNGYPNEALVQLHSQIRSIYNILNQQIRMIPPHNGVGSHQSQVRFLMQNNIQYRSNGPQQTLVRPQFGGSRPPLHPHIVTNGLPGLHVSTPNPALVRREFMQQQQQQVLNGSEAVQQPQQQLVNGREVMQQQHQQQVLSNNTSSSASNVLDSNSMMGNQSESSSGHNSEEIPIVPERVESEDTSPST